METTGSRLQSGNVGRHRCRLTGTVFKDGVELVVDRFMLWTAKGTTGDGTQGGN